MRATYAVLGMVLFFAACAPSQAPEESGEAAPTEGVADESGASPGAQAVSQLNAMCPENWCAGDYQYEFTEITCAGAGCTLTFTAERGGEVYDGTLQLDYDEPLIDEFGDLEPGYFERVSDGLDEWESSQPGAGA